WLCWVFTVTSYVPASPWKAGSRKLKVNSKPSRTSSETSVNRSQEYLWELMSTMRMICEDLNPDTKVMVVVIVKYPFLYFLQANRRSTTFCATRTLSTGLSDEAEEVVYQMKRVTSVGQREEKAATLCYIRKLNRRWIYCQNSSQ
ncbi:circularly permutated Ras protein 1 isoform X1, partial [Tachysurus ichikawai]